MLINEEPDLLADPFSLFRWTELRFTDGQVEGTSGCVVGAGVGVCCLENESIS